jgi:hypothetical protein
MLKNNMKSYKKLVCFFVSILTYCLPRQSEARDIFLSRIDDSTKAYSIEANNKYLFLSDYQNGSIKIKNSKNKLIKTIDSVNIEGRETRLNFVHSALPLNNGEIFACLSKKNKNNPKLQGQAIVVNLDKNIAYRIDKIFHDDEFLSFPTTCSFVNGEYAVSYSGSLNAVIFYNSKGDVTKIIGNREVINKNLKNENTRNVPILNLILSNPHKVIGIDGAIIIADTGNNSVVKILGDDINYLTKIEDDAYSWSSKKPISPIFSSPTSIKIHDHFLYVVENERGVIRKINLDMKNKLKCEDLFLRRKFTNAPIKAFDITFLQNSIIVTSPENNSIFSGYQN